MNFRSVWVLMAFLVLPAALARGQEIHEIRVENRGTVALDPSSVRAFISLSEGEVFDPVDVLRDVHRLRDTHRYRQVEVDVNPREDGSVSLTYGVAAKPRLTRIQIFGAEALQADLLKDKLALSVGDWIDESDLASAEVRVREAYIKRGYLKAEVEARIEEDPSAGTAILRMEINEGIRGRVLSYSFEGNTALDHSRLQQGLLQKRARWYKPWHWFGWRAPRFDEVLVEEDRHRLRRKYLNEGYLDAQIGDPVVEVARSGGIRVHIPIEEGPRYTLGEIRVENVTMYDPEEVRAAAALSPGTVASLSALEQAADRIADFYGSRGHYGVFAQPRLAPTEDAVVNILFSVYEQPKATLRHILFRGNEITRDRVLRREVVIRPGDTYNRRRVQTSERRLQNLGYFSSVQSRMNPVEKPHAYDLVFNVEEQRMGQAAFGVGFSSIDEVTGYAEISHGNFDLCSWPPVGNGQKARLRATSGTTRSEAELSFVEPFFLGRRLALGVDVFHRDSSYLSSDFDQRETGGQISLTQQTGPFSRATLSYSMERFELRNVSPNAAPVFLEEASYGPQSKSAMTLTLRHDTRDQFRIPTRGHRARATFQIAGGPLMGDTHIYSVNVRTVHYFPVWRGHVLMVRGEAGVVDRYGDSDHVPYFDRYFLGGADTIRAFEYRDVGPRDETGEVIGGRSRALATAEYTVPIVSIIRAAVFYDVGMVWGKAYRFDSDLHSGYGVGVRLDIPMMPLRFDYAWPIQADAFNDDPSGRFSFYIGYGL